MLFENPAESVLTPREASARLEVFAAYERHMQDRDALIASRIWELMEQKAMQTPPPLRRHSSTRSEDEFFSAGEYLRWSKRHPAPAFTRWDALGWGVILLAGCIFFGERIPGVHEFLTDLLKGLF